MLLPFTLLKKVAVPKIAGTIPKGYTLETPVS
jgi:hypothetical protein